MRGWTTTTPDYGNVLIADTHTRCNHRRPGLYSRWQVERESCAAPRNAQHDVVEDRSLARQLLPLFSLIELGASHLYADLADQTGPSELGLISVF